MRGIKRPDIPDEKRVRWGSKRNGVNYGHKTGIYIDNDLYPLDWANCGTLANYRAHLRRGQEACRLCKRAASRKEDIR